MDLQNIHLVQLIILIVKLDAVNMKSIQVTLVVEVIVIVVEHSFAQYILSLSASVSS